MVGSRRPTISIGMPVFNGESYVDEAIRSILGQTFDDLELVIFDNASSDGTEAICREHARSDPRVRYSRNDRNLGAAANYNLAFDESRGEYFKWCAHDDLLRPEYLEQCLSALQSSPDAVLCQSLIEYIDAQGKTIGVYDSRQHGSDAPRPSTRFAAMILIPHPCNEFFGLMRRQSAVGSMLHGNYHGADKAFLAQMALRGRILQLGQPLLALRDHPGRYSNASASPRFRLAWHDTARARHRNLPVWRQYGELWRMARHEIRDRGERWRCYGLLVRWWTANWNWARMAVDPVAALFPGALPLAERIKHRIFGPAPGAALFTRNKSEGEASRSGSRD